MTYPKTKRTLMSLAVASAVTSFVIPAHAQQTAPAAANTTPQATDTTTVLVTGIRKSLQSSMNLKRNADGIVDGIVAEDIGKFPDTNLAESLQRISGVSIDRVNGEGSKVTVRGIGPDYNLVLLNGRQMPTSNFFDGLAAPNNRSFDFANLASEAISQIQVYKSARSETPTGGIGATLNVLTARPLDNPGFHATVGVKGVYDESFKNLPGDIQHGNSQVTPEFSGIFSDTFNDKMFGVSVSASYQERHSGTNIAGADAGFVTSKGYDSGWGALPTPTAANPTLGQTNLPAPNSVYAVPLSTSYSVTGVDRKRTNGQAVFQFAPTNDIKTTLDYTYAQNKVVSRTASLGAWMAIGGDQTGTVWNSGAVASPLLYKENNYSSPSDITSSGSYTASRTDLNSIGFNGQWKATDKLKLELDAHHSTSETKPDSPYGFNNSLGVSSYSRMGSQVDFSGDFPVLTIPGEDYTASPPRVSGSSFRNALQKMTVDQVQAKGSLRLTEDSTLNFGLAATNVKNRSAYSDNQNGAWGNPGASADTTYAPNTWHLNNMANYFDQFAGASNPALSGQFFTYDFDNVINQISQKPQLSDGLAHPELYRMKDTYDVDRRTEEKSKSLYVQWNADWDATLPLHTAAGLRYEKTDVTSSAQVPIATGFKWIAPNEFNVINGPAGFTTLDGKYNYLLPSVDADLDVTKDQKLRVSYSENIGRPKWGDIQGGQTLDILARVNGGTGSQGNPALEPVKSKNIDLSYEWYYGKQNYMSVGFFRKNLRNFTGSAVITETPFSLHTPAGGALWNEAIATGGCASSDSACIYNWIITNKQQPGVVEGTNIIGQPGDPIVPFRVTIPVNQQSAGVSGAEVAIQHMFGNTGFGVAANYTYVRSNLHFDISSMNQQFVLPGLSNSGNLTGIYEDTKWSIRVAYNWRGEFYSGAFSNAGPANPIFVEPYGQVDLNVGYNVNDNLALSFEGINVTNATQRSHFRDSAEVFQAIQGGPRYMVGARYKF